MSDQVIVHRLFVDGITRPVYVGLRGQYVLDGGEQVYGTFIGPGDESPDTPLVVDCRDSRDTGDPR